MRPTVKFTPERIEQIKNLVERGKRREEIAELIGVTVGSPAAAHHQQRDSAAA